MSLASPPRPNATPWRDPIPGDTRCVLAAAMLQKRAARSKYLDAHLPFSLLRTLRTVIAYALVLSDVLRSGIGVHDLNETSLENESGRVWSYKYDTTSVVWRTFAKFYGLDTFPDCLFYRRKCKSDHLSSAVVFDMIDSLANAIAHAQDGQKSSKRAVGPVFLTLHTAARFFDKIHHCVLPQIFMNPSLRTNQALHYTSEVLRQLGFSLCFTHRSVRPAFCGTEWVNFERSCPRGNAACRSVGHVGNHILRRAYALQARFGDTGDFQVDLAVLSSQESIRTVKGGACDVSRRDVDVSTVLRMRSRACFAPPEMTSSGGGCKTIYVDNYRYEATVYTSDIVQWYRVVSGLWIIGQAYFFVRLIMSLVSCYVTCASEEVYEHATILQCVVNARLLFARIPSQCAVYGSMFPMLSYALAHFIDAPIMYEMVTGSLATSNGLLSISAWDFCIIAAVQMRSLWALMLIVQVVLAVITLRRKPDWTLRLGILGVPSLSVSFLSSWTIFSQFRLLSLRDSRVLAIEEIATHRVTDTTPPALINHQVRNKQRDIGSAMLEGVILGFKFFLAMLAAILLWWALWHCAVPLLQWGWSHLVGNQAKSGAAAQRSGLILATTPTRHATSKYAPAASHEFWTPVPYSAGTLWSIVPFGARWKVSQLYAPRVVAAATPAAGIVCWVRSLPALWSPSVAPAPPPFTAGGRNPYFSRMSTFVAVTPSNKTGSFDRSDVTIPAPERDTRKGDGVPEEWATWPKSKRNLDMLLFLQFHLEHVHWRHDEVDAVVALFNLVQLSDLITFFGTKVSGTALGFYETQP